MRCLLLLVIATAVVQVAIGGSCPASQLGSPFLPSSKSVSDAESCEWYQSDSCCEASVNTSTIVEDYVWKDSSKNCRELINLAYCAPCSGQSSVFLSVDNKGRLQYKICKSFCRRIFDSCKGDKFNGKAVSDYSSSDDFCSAAFTDMYGQISAYTASGQCFNSATNLHPVMALVTSIIASMFFFAKY